MTEKQIEKPKEYIISEEFLDLLVKFVLVRPVADVKAHFGSVDLVYAHTEHTLKQPYKCNCINEEKKEKSKK